ncbi:MAG: DoxX family protein [Xanthomonadaceae bacterium]|nr:DoxX family protein [Xanthomonadaceae bacterium]MDE2278983.1 DoxX family protein [Xanthomonadaceae bacterium]MDE2314989.1 DoxX family protein [Xanthomonadaceae bacterium]
MHAIIDRWSRLTARLAVLTPLALLLFRVFVALAFWRAGVVKWSDPSGTAYLFENEYHVPLLAPAVAAAVGMWTELVLPWFLALGLGTRVVAAVLFVYNIIAVISYPALWPNGLWHGLLGADFNDHKAWGLMLLALVALGAGQLSLDTLLRRVLARR